MSSSVDISVPHLIPLKPSGSEWGLEDRVEAKQLINKILNKIIKILTFFMVLLYIRKPRTSNKAPFFTKRMVFARRDFH
jgi:hypothetical protein